MARCKFPAALVALAASLMLISAAPPPQEIASPRSKWVIAVPPRSLVKFRRWHEDGYAQFDGRFLLTGEYALTLVSDGVCESPRREDCLTLDVEPDPAIKARLPHLKNGGDMWVTIEDERRLVQSITRPKQRAALVAGKIQSVTGRTSIIVDQFSVGSDCESVWYSARFVALAKPLKPARTEFDGGFGCGY